jgi:hypothetical protein
MNLLEQYKKGKMGVLFSMRIGHADCTYEKARRRGGMGDQESSDS